VEALGIKLIKKQFHGKMLGACKSKGLNRLIAISSELNGKRERFTVAHELGHLIIHYGAHYCNSEDLQMHITTKDKEGEANSFAAELLLPTSAVMRQVKNNDISFDIAEKMSKQYGMSLTATMLKLVDLCDEKITFFYQMGGIIKWSYSSSEIKLRPILGQAIAGSLAQQVSSIKTKLAGYVDPEYWFENIDGPDIKCFEESIYWPKYSLTLTTVRIENE
jgi:hypothetical protein